MFDRHLPSWPRGVPRRITVPERPVHANLALSAARAPDAPAIHYHGRTLSYGALLEAVEALAGWLAHHGAGRGDRVLLFVQNSPQLVIGYYAVLRAGAVVVPVNPMSRAMELDHLLADTGARLAVAGQELLEHLAPALRDGRLRHVVSAACAEMADPRCDLPLPEGLDAPARPAPGPGVTPFPEALAAGHPPPPDEALPDDLAVIPYTSGTTGRQKGCMHTHRTVQWTALGSIRWIPHGLGRPTLATLPLYHVTGMQNSMNGPVLAGDPVVIMSRWDRGMAAELIRRHRVSRWRSISTMAIDLVNDPALGGYDLSSLEAIGGGGAAMPEAVAHRLEAATGLRYVEGYGMSEAMAGTHINPPDAPRPQCLGIPVFDVDSRVVDPETGRELGPGELGEILIRAPQVFRGYWNDPEATGAAFVEHDGARFLRTGDIGRYDADGFFYMVDRVKRMVNAGGFKVWPAEVEALLHGHPAVAEACVVGRPEGRRGEAVRAYVVARGPLDPEEVRAWCRARMAAYKVPREVVAVEALPRSPSGKVMWRRLQEEAARGPAA
jgi:fatty-acyl-CoA synthase